MLAFDGGYVLRSHLRMSGRWLVEPRDRLIRGRPWLVLRGQAMQAVLWNGPVLELHTRSLRCLGPDILAAGPDLQHMIERLRGDHGGRAVGDALLDQRLVGGIGNVWKAESLWRAEVSPWRAIGDLTDDELRSVLEWASRLMRKSLELGREARAIHGRAGRPCPRCGDRIASRGQGDDNRTAYWCPTCQSAGRRSISGGNAGPAA